MTLDTITASATAPGTGAAMTAATGDSLIIRNGLGMILCLAAWTKAQAAGTTTVLWPSGHDLVRNIRMRNLANQTDNKVAKGLPWQFRAQDPLQVNQVGSATAGDIEVFQMLLWYEDLPGTDAKMINIPSLRRRGVSSLTVEDTTTATAGAQYSGQRTLVQAADTLKPNTNYAVLGAVLGAVCAGLSIRSVDLGGLRATIPGLSQDANVTGDWFMTLADLHDVPCIPVINSANRNSVFIDNVQDENLTAVPFSLNLVELAPA